MAKLARDIMTPDPACCTPTTMLDDVAKLMAQNDRGEIPVIDSTDQVVGVLRTATSCAAWSPQEQIR